MAELAVFSPSEQVAAHLRGKLLRGTWSGEMPGTPQLAAELGIDRKTITAALGLLEEEGLLVSQGVGRRRRIVPQENLAPPALRVAILDYEPLEQTEDWSVAMLQRLQGEGHSAFFAEKSMIELGFNLRRIARLVKRTPADAWVVCSGSRDVLQWFAEQETPAFALFGRRRGLPIAGISPDHPAAWRAATRRLLELGHQRIVILERGSRQQGGAGGAERAVLEEIADHGFPTGPYNLPNWEDTPEGLQHVLDELFRLTPPTALIIDEAFLFHAVKEHLSQKGIVAPKDVSLVCSDPDPTFVWCRPTVAHIRWNLRPVVRRVVDWTNNMARGRKDLRQSFTKAEFVDGATVGIVPKGRDTRLPGV